MNPPREAYLKRRCLARRTARSDLGNVRGAARIQGLYLEGPGDNRCEGAAPSSPFFAHSHLGLVSLKQSAPCCRAFCLNLPGTPDRNLPTLGLGLRYRNVDFEHSILEVGVCLINLSAFRQGYEPSGSLLRARSTDF
jgi:hypothetical protein